MSQYDNTNKGALWKNDKRETDKHPHYTGSINVEGKEYWLSAWKTDGSNPKAPLVNIAIKSKDSQTAPNPGSQNLHREDDFDDDLPF